MLKVPSGFKINSCFMLAGLIAFFFLAKIIITLLLMPEVLNIKSMLLKMEDNINCGSYQTP